MTTAIFLLFIALFAISEAWRDGAAIARHEPINHAKGLLFRLAVGSIFFGCASALHWIVAHDFRFILFAPMGWAAFTMLFRFVLNRDLRHDWRYISPSNWYDRRWMRLASPGLEVDEENHRDWYIASSTYADKIHRAGTLAYAFELAVFLASIAAFIAL